MFVVKNSDIFQKEIQQKMKIEPNWKSDEMENWISGQNWKLEKNEKMHNMEKFGQIWILDTI